MLLFAYFSLTHICTQFGRDTYKGSPKAFSQFCYYTYNILLILFLLTKQHYLILQYFPFYFSADFNIFRIYLMFSEIQGSLQDTLIFLFKKVLICYEKLNQFLEKIMNSICQSVFSICHLIAQNSSLISRSVVNLCTHLSIPTSVTIIISTFLYLM